MQERGLSTEVPIFPEGLLGRVVLRVFSVSVLFTRSIVMSFSHSYREWTSSLH